ncbi:MAG: polysaccharide biosynthesis protein [Acidimicrobiales bacterium]
MLEVFEEHRPEVVFHAAALKHVPLLELYPVEAAKTNVLGTANVLAAAVKYGVGTFVNVSTDRAASPENDARLHQAHHRAADRSRRPRSTRGRRSPACGSAT